MLGRKLPDPSPGLPKKAGAFGALGAIGDIVKQIQAIEPERVIAMFGDAVAELKRHNEIQARIVERLDVIEARLSIVPLMESQLDALENLVRMTVPGAEAQLTERDVMIADGGQSVQTGEAGNGVFTQITDTEHPAFRSFEEARNYVHRVQNGALK